MLFTDTELIRQELLNLRIAPPERIRVLPLGLDLEPFRNLVPFQGHLRKLLRLPPHTRIVGTVARLVPIKGIEYLLEAAAMLLSQQPHLHFVIAGDGQLRIPLMEKADQLGISQQVSFLGFWKDLREIYADLDLLVVPSLSEGCPVAILEGMAAGKPVVGSAVGGIPDVISDGINGLLVPPKDPERLAAAIHRCLNQGKFAAQLAAQSQRDVFERFTITKSVDATEKYYRELFHASVG